MGSIGGGIWHGIKGARNSPRVRFFGRVVRYHRKFTSSSLLQGERLVGAISVIKARAPVTGGNFGVWGGMFSTFDCAVKGWRQKEDAWNAIISGFMTGGCLAARSTCSVLTLFEWCLTTMFSGGPRSAFGSAVACGILLGVFEGVGVLLNRVFSEGNRQQLPPCKSTFFF